MAVQQIKPAPARFYNIFGYLSFIQFINICFIFRVFKVSVHALFKINIDLLLIGGGYFVSLASLLFGFAGNGFGSEENDSPKSLF